MAGNCIIVCPFGNGALSVIEAEEQTFVEQFVAHQAIEGLNIAILHRLSRRDIMPFDLMVFRPGEDRIRGEFRTVVGNDHAGLAAPFDERCQRPGSRRARPAYDLASG